MTACILLVICYLLTYYFPKVRYLIIDNILKLMFNRFSLSYLELTQTVITKFTTRSPKLFIIIINLYFLFLILYYVDVIWLKYDIIMDTTISYYFFLYSIRTMIFLPSFIVGLIINHPRAEGLLQEFFKRNPSYLIGAADLPEFFRGLNRTIKIIMDQGHKVLKEHPNFGPVIQAGAMAGVLVGSQVHRHGATQKKKMEQIEYTQQTYQHWLEEQHLSIPRTPKVLQASAEFFVSKQDAAVKTVTGPSACQDTLWSMWKHQRDSVEKFQDASENLIKIISKEVTGKPSRPPVNSSKEYYFFDLL